MKSKIFIKTLILGFLFAYVTGCSEDFLEKTPTGTALIESLASEKGVKALLTGAYAALDGAPENNLYAWAGAVSNWVWGSTASDDAYKGSEFGDQNTINPIERYEALPDNGYLHDKWRANYDGIARVNDVLKTIEMAGDQISEAKKAQFKAEAYFLRAWFHFELKRVFNNIPYITEIVDPVTVPNNIDAWPLIETDLLAAINTPLPETQTDIGRPTIYAAKAVLARVYLFQKKYTQAAAELDDIIESGNYRLTDNFKDNFLIATRNNEESIFEIQYSVNDGADGSTNANYGDALNFPHGSDIGLCCGFFQPSQDLVNVFQVDANGLPLLDSYATTEFHNDMGIASASSFLADATTPVDPRLDHTVGRRGIPFLDWGVMRGRDWIRDQNFGGPYLNKKQMFLKTERNIYSTTTGWAAGVNANNYRAYRYAHILLWRAECYIEDDGARDLEAARTLINEIRIRAANDVVMGRSTQPTLENAAAAELNVDYNQPAANYIVNPYNTPFADVEYARKALRIEMRLEFAMEGQRFFDLVRWGIAKQVLDAFITNDANFRSFMSGARFDAGVNEYWPIPQTQIDLVGSDIYTQNPY